MSSHTIELAGSVERSLEALERAAEWWGADWQRSGTGGRLELPVVAGIRRGTIVGGVSTRRLGESIELRLDVEGEEYHLQTRQAVVLLLGGLGGAVLLLVPFLPDLVRLVPAGIILLLAAWFLVAARLRHRGARDFLESVIQHHRELTD